MEKILFKGIFPALPTPFDTEERLKRKALEEIMDFGYSGGVNGFYVCGATGEGPVLPLKTRMDALEAVISHNNGRGKIIAHIGAPNFSDVKALAAHAESCGVDALSSMAPNAYYAHSDRETVDYYKEIAFLTKLPLLVYVTPLLLGNNLASVFEELMSVPNIIGLKFTLSDYYLMTKLKMINGGNINVINGPDEMLLAGLSMGADGGIGSTYNLMPDRFTALYSAFKNGDVDKAREIQYGINKIIHVLIKDKRTIGAIKAAFELMDIDAGACAFPCKAFSPEEKAALKKELIHAGYEFKR